MTPHLDLILDGSRSMNLPETAKAGAVARLAALLATAAANAQCTQAVWLSGEGFQRLPNDTLTPSAWDRLELDSRRTPEQSLAILPPKFRRLGVRVLISDLRPDPGIGGLQGAIRQIWPVAPDLGIERRSPIRIVLLIGTCLW